jgi:hypothetical protein
MTIMAATLIADVWRHYVGGVDVDPGWRELVIRFETGRTSPHEWPYYL